MVMNDQIKIQDHRIAKNSPIYEQINENEYEPNGPEILKELIVSIQKRYDMFSFGE